jgi:mono/diheme cytochrome c family protein
MKKVTVISAITAIASVVLFATPSVFAEGLLPSTPARIEAGKALYAKNCLPCHGEKGDGKGPAGKMMKPQPRDFREGKFVNGDKPENIFKTIGEGLPGTAMAKFKFTDEERSSLAHYVLTLKGSK